MSISEEQNFLLQSVRRWFNRPDQITHYIDEVGSGPSKAEQYLLSFLPNTGTLLDVGCGAGRISMYLAEKGYSVTGTDISEGLISKARELSKNKDLDIDFILTDRTELPFRDEMYDSIVGFKVLCYIPSRDLRHEYLKELYRVLKPGGSMYLTQNIVPDEYIGEAQDEYFQSCLASRFTIIEQGDNFPLGEGYVRWFTERELIDEINKANFLIELFESDELHNGTGYLRLIKLKKFSKHFEEGNNLT